MNARYVSFAFFCAAAWLSATPAFAVTEISINNLGGNGVREVKSDERLVVDQQINDTFSGDLTGGGSLVKTGSAGLTLDGGIELSRIEVLGGTLTLGSNITFSGTANPTITNKSTVALGFSSADSNLTIEDSERVGTVVSTGTLTATRLAGNLLNVNAGTLTVEMDAAFKQINVLSGAALQIGTGETGSLATLAGNVNLEDSAKLIFNRKATSGADKIDYSGKISGNGELVFNGSAITYFKKGIDQTYTGKTTVNAGGMLFVRDTVTGSDGREYYNPEAKAAELASSEIQVNPGAHFGGHTTVAGNVNVAGTAFSSVADWNAKVGQNTFGAWQLGAGTLYATSGDTLTVNGNLKIAKTEYGVYFPTETSFDYAGNSGGALRVDVDVVAGAVRAGNVVANGNVELGGTLILAGGQNLPAGHRFVIFESDPEKTTGAFEQVAYYSDNVTLLLPGVGGIAEGQYGAATVENRNVRKRASFDEHDGISSFVDYLVGQSNEMNKIAQAVALSDAASVSDTVNNFSALPYCSLAEMAIRQSGAELDMVLLEISRARRTPPPSSDGVRVPANFTFFSGLITDFVDHEKKNDNPVYDFDNLGAYLGGHSWLDDERIAGFSVGLHHGSANPHGNGGTLEDIAARAKIFAVFTPKFSNWFLTVGASVGVHHYDINRKTALGENFGNTDGVDAGLFVAYNYRAEIEKDLYFTPYLRFEYNFSYVGGLTESGSASRLDLSRLIYNNYRLRVGSGFEYFAGEGKVFGIDFGFVGSFGERPEITSEFVEYRGSRNKIRGTVDEPMSFEIAPRVGLMLGDDWTADAVYRVQTSFSGSLSHMFGIGLSKEF